MTNLSPNDRNKIFAATFSGAAFILLVGAASGESSPLLLLGRPIALVFLGVLAHRGHRLAIRALSVWFFVLALSLVGMMVYGGAAGLGFVVAAWTAVLLGFWAVRLWGIRPQEVESSAAKEATTSSTGDS